MLDGEAEEPSQVDSLGARGRDAPDQHRWHGGRSPHVPAIEDRLHVHRIPGHHEVGQQAQGVCHGLHLIGLLGWVASHPAGVDRALQGVGGLAAIEHAQQFPPKGFVDEVIGQEHSPQQLAELHECLVQRISARSGAKARERIDRAGVAAVHGGKQVHHPIPLCFDLGRIETGVTDRAQDRGDLAPARQEQVSILQGLQARTQVKPHPSGQGHAGVGVAMGIDGELGGLETLLAHHAFDGGTVLALVEQDGLCIGDPEASARKLVDALKRRGVAEELLRDALGEVEHSDP